ncbi:MAG: hypothetical protein COB17_02275 [Sulfurimonas sp.]|nr:MAG: hypothetical protein COB17_02275 [Sulfurimonas sp.]
MNYKKSLLSLATVMALSNSSIADTGATYTPLSSDTADSMWVLFGVNGYSNGTASALGTVTGAFSGGLTSLTDTSTSDTLSTAGLLAADSVGNLAALQAIDSTTTSLQVGVNLTGTIFDPTEPVRTIYIKVGGASAANVKFEYKASLEGKSMEIIRNGSLFNIVINQNSTYSSAITAITGGIVASTSTNDRTNIIDILDYNTSNNPTNPIHFDSTKHFQTATGISGTAAQTASMYHFNSVTQQWEVWNKNSPSGGDDFTRVYKGNAYWGRVDINDPVATLNNDAGGAAGLILGNDGAGSGIPDPKVYRDESNVSTLSPGWNMLAFDDAKPYIRHASTGLVLTGVDINDTLVISDDTGTNSITYDVNATGNVAAIDQTLATALNKAIESAKLLGTVPTSFNLKAFYGGTAGTFTLISDKKFTVSTLDNNGTGIGVKTLSGANPYVSGTRQAVTNLYAATNKEATSAYGEYSLMVDLLTSDLYGSDTAATLDSITNNANAVVSAKVLFGDASGDNTAIALTTVANADPTATTFNTTLKSAAPAGDPIFNGVENTGRSVAIDTNNNGTNDKVIISSTVPFYIKDNTFTRVHAFTAGVGSITIDVSTPVTINTTGASTATSVATLIDAQADASAVTGVFAARGVTSSNIVTVSTTNNLFDLKDVASGTLDFLTATTDSNITTKGAVAGVYSLDNVAALPLIQHLYLANYLLAAQPDSTGDTLDINLTIKGTLTGVADLNASTAAIANTTAGRLAYFDQIVAEINRQIKTVSGAHAYATHDYTEAIDSFTGTKILVSGLDVTRVLITENTEANVNQVRQPSTPTDSNAATADQLGSGLTTGDLIADLKQNAVWTPNFATQGPLYTLRNSDIGYDVRAILKATTEMDSNTGNVTWDSIDVTRDEADWFNNNAFNLFKINNNAGYWVYLESKTVGSVTVSGVTLSAKPYTYYFKAATPFTTTNTITNGSLTMTITGLDDVSGAGTNNAASAYAVIGGEEIQLLRTSGTNTFTGEVSSYALSSFAESTSPINVDIRAVNGKGQEVTVSTAISIDYTRPTAMTATDSSSTNIALSATGGDIKNFYIWEDYIPEVQTTRSVTGTASGNLVATVAATANAGNVSICPTFNFATINSLRILAADGAINSSNLSDAVEYKYTSGLKGAHVLTHIQGSGTSKTQIGVTYDSNCAQTTTQPTLATDNDGVSVASLTTGATVRLSFIPDSIGSNFTQDVAWTSNYALTAAGTAIVQVQSTSAYSGSSFILEYNGALYRGAFPTSQSAADVSISSTLGLTATSSANVSLVP